MMMGVDCLLRSGNVINFIERQGGKMRYNTFFGLFHMKRGFFGFSIVQYYSST